MLRRALGADLPDVVRERLDKAEFGVPTWQVLRSWLPLDAGLYALANLGWARRAATHRGFVRDLGSAPIWTAWSVLGLECWARAALGRA